MLQMSILWSYLFWVRITSGARYQRLTTQLLRSRGRCRFSLLKASSEGLIFSLKSLQVCILASLELLSIFLNIFLRISRNYLSVSSFFGIVRLRPKSQSLTLQLELIKKFPGLISRWMMLAEWMKLRAHRELYIIVTMCSSCRGTGGVDDKSFFMSLSTSSKTRKI